MPKIMLTPFSSIIAGLAVMAAFVTATTYTQLAVAVLLYPVVIFLAYKVFPPKTNQEAVAVVNVVSQPQVKVEQKTETTNKSDRFSITDIDKRLFLKLIGGAGLSILLFSLFNRKVTGLIPGMSSIAPSGTTSLKDISGNKIDPAKSHPTDGYTISELDESVVSYYGFINQGGSWYIMKEDADSGTFRYIKGTSNFPQNWTTREKLNYDYFSNVFKP